MYQRKDASVNKSLEKFLESGPTGWLPADIVFMYVMCGFITLFIVKISDEVSKDGRKNDTTDDILCFLLWPILVVAMVSWVLNILWTGPRKLWRYRNQ